MQNNFDQLHLRPTHLKEKPKNIQGDTFIWKTPFISEMTNFFSNLMYPMYNMATML